MTEIMKLLFLPDQTIKEFCRRNTVTYSEW